MNIGDHLKDFATRFPKCTATMFADMSTRLVLASENPEDITQEVLDDLLARAVHRFDTREFELVNRCLEQNDEHCPSTMISLHPAGYLCLVTIPKTDEAMCLLLKHDAPVAETLQEAISLFSLMLETV